MTHHRTDPVVVQVIIASCLSATLKGLKDSRPGYQTETYGPVLVEIETSGVIVFLYADASVGELSKWKKAVPGSEIKFRARLDAIAALSARGKREYAFTLRAARIIE